MFLWKLFIIASLLNSLDNDHTDYFTDLFGVLILGFSNMYPEMFLYEIDQAISTDISEESDEDIDLNLLFLTNFSLSFLPTTGALVGDFAFNTIESTTCILSGLFSLLIIGLEDSLNESYNASISIWLWPFFMGLELMTLALRTVSLSIRITSNTVAGHVLTSLLTLGVVLSNEYATSWAMHGIMLFFIMCTLGVEVMESIISSVQVYVWCVLGGTYSTTLA